MTVEQFKEKYEALQKEGNEIYAQIKPLLKRLKTLAKNGLNLADKTDGDKGLYEPVQVKVGEFHGMDTMETRYVPNWNESILFRLWDFDFLVNDPNNSAIDAIDNVLYNLKHTKFLKKGHRKGKMVKVSLPTSKTSVGTIAIPEKVAKNIPPMDM